MSGALTTTYRNAAVSRYVSDFSSVESSDIGFSRRTSKLAVFYCTKCGTYHDAITRCPKHQMVSNDGDHEKERSAAPSIYFSSHEIKTKIDDHSKVQQNSNLEKYELAYIQKNKNEFIITAARFQDQFNTENKACPEEPDEVPWIDEMQTFSEKIIQEKPQETGENSKKVIRSLSNIQWATFEGRLQGAGYDPNPNLPVLTKVEELHILEDNNPPAPSSSAGQVLREKIFKHVYPPQVIHKKCARGYTKLIPPWMGWAWNKQDQTCGAKQFQYNPDWRPGAVSSKVARLMKQNYGEPELMPVKPKKRVKKKKKEEDIDGRPMLEVVKRQKCYLITMNPMKNPYARQDEEQVAYAPIHFIVDRRNNVVEEVQPGCDCICSCDSSSASHSSEVESSSSESEFEFSFTPPICLVDREQIKQVKNVTETGTQFDPEMANGQNGKKKGGKKGKRKGGRKKKK